MKNTILILIPLLFLTGCEKEVTSLQNRGGVKYEINSETPFTGRLVKKYEDGQKEFEWNYTNGELDGRLTYWDKEGNVTKTEGYKDGQKIYEGNWKNGKEDGFYTEWYENGQKMLEGNFKNGKLEGLGTQWYENGQKDYEGNFIDGKEEGLWTWWDEEGNVTETEIFKDGGLVE